MCIVGAISVANCYRHNAVSFGTNMTIGLEVIYWQDNDGDWRVGVRANGELIANQIALDQETAVLAAELMSKHIGERFAHLKARPN